MLTPLSKDSNATVSSERDSRNLPTAAFITRDITVNSLDGLQFVVPLDLLRDISF